MKKFSRNIFGFVLIASLAVILFNSSFGGSVTRFNQSFHAPAVYAEEPATPSAPAATTDSGAAATEGNKTADEKIDVGKMVDKIIQSSTVVNRIFAPMIHFLVFQIGNFLGNDFIYGGTMGEMLHSIWVIMRNIVNIAFAILLLVIAFMNVIQPGAESNFGMKKMLPKFVLLLVAVNFSWLACRVMLDAANVATNVVFQIPAGVQSVAPDITTPCTKGADAKFSGSCYPDKIYFPFNAQGDADFSSEECPTYKMVADNYPVTSYDENGEKRVTEARERDPNIWQKRIFCWQTMDLSKYNQNTASIFLSYGVLKIQKLGMANEKGGLMRTFIGTLFALAIQIVYLGAFLALWLALIARAAVLWLLVAFSPLLVLVLFIKDFGGNLPEQLSFNSFIKYAFMPAKLGAVLSVGFVMIAAGQGMGNPVEKANMGEILEVSSLFAGMDTIQEFIWLVMVIIVVWLGVFGILGQTPVVSNLTGWIGEWGKRAGKFIATTPKWAPIIPMGVDQDGKTKWANYNQLDQKIQEAERRFQYGGVEGEKVNKAVARLKEVRQEEREELVAMAQNPSRHQEMVVKLAGHIDGGEDALKTMVRDGRLSTVLQGAEWDAAQVTAITQAAQKRYGVLKATGVSAGPKEQAPDAAKGESGAGAGGAAGEGAQGESGEAKTR